MIIYIARDGIRKIIQETQIIQITIHYNNETRKNGYKKLFNKYESL